MPLSQKHSISERAWDLTFTAILAVFFISKFLVHGDLLPVDFEDFEKMRFMAFMESPSFFLPWSKADGLFFGHPGMMNFLYYCFSKIFGNGIEQMRAFLLFMCCSSVATFYLLLILVTKRPVAFSTCLSFLVLPQVQVQSVLFLNEYGSFGLVFLGLWFYLRQNLWAASLLLTMAVLYLESAVAYPLAIMGYESYRQIRHKAPFELNKFIALAVPLFSLVLFFYLRTLGETPPAPHNTQDLVIRRLLNPTMIFHEVDMAKLAKARWRTFSENMHPFIAVILICGGLLGAFLTRTAKIRYLLHVLFISFMMQLVFFSFYSSNEGGRDFTSGFFFLFASLYTLIDEKKLPRWLPVAALAPLFVFSCFRLNKNRFSWFQTTLHTYSRADTWYDMADRLATDSRRFQCYPKEGYFSSVFCSELYGLKPENITPVTYGSTFNAYFSYEGRVSEENYLQRHFQVHQVTELGKFRGKSVLLYQLK